MGPLPEWLQQRTPHGVLPTLLQPGMAEDFLELSFDPCGRDLSAIIKLPKLAGFERLGQQLLGEAGARVARDLLDRLDRWRGTLPGLGVSLVKVGEDRSLAVYPGVDRPNLRDVRLLAGQLQVPFLPLKTLFLGLQGFQRRTEIGLSLDLDPERLEAGFRQEGVYLTLAVRKGDAAAEWLRFALEEWGLGTLAQQVHGSFRRYWEHLVTGLAPARYYAYCRFGEGDFTLHLPNPLVEDAARITRAWGSVPDGLVDACINSYGPMLSYLSLRFANDRTPAVRWSVLAGRPAVKVPEEPAPVPWVFGQVPPNYETWD